METGELAFIVPDQKRHEPLREGAGGDTEHEADHVQSWDNLG